MNWQPCVIRGVEGKLAETGLADVRPLTGASELGVCEKKSLANLFLRRPLQLDHGFSKDGTESRCRFLLIDTLFTEGMQPNELWPFLVHL